MGTSTQSAHSDLQFVPAVKMLDLGLDPMANWPWPRKQNPHYLEIKIESNEWINSLKPFNPASQRAFEKGDFCLLAALAYPNLSREHFRVACDFMILFFLIDEYTDVESAEVVKEMVDICVDAIHHPHIPRPKNECIIGEATKQFWELTIKTAKPTCQYHIIKTFIEYLNSVVEQAKDRDNDEIQSIESYIANRRFNIGIYPSLALYEQPLNIPDKAIYHPLVIELQEYIADLVWIANDIASYNKEQAIGDVRHNILTVVMHELGCDYTKALEWALDYHIQVEKKFLEGMKNLPSFGEEVDRELGKYLYEIGFWPRGNDSWDFESGRYFGDKGLEVQKTRQVPLLPKMQHDKTHRQGDVVVQEIFFDSIQ